MCCARAALAAGPNGDPYRVYKGAPDVLKYLWKLMVIEWKKGTSPRMWRQAGGIFIPKENTTVTTGQF